MTTTTRKKVLMVAYHYPPLTGSSGLQRTLGFSRYLPEHGWDPIVLSISPIAYAATSDDQQRDVPHNIEVIRAFGLDTRRHLAVAGRYLQMMAVPDRWVSWTPFAVLKGMSLIKRHRPSAIWSTFPIATAHRIGAQLHRRSGIPWVADFRDSMTEENYPAQPAIWRSFRRIEKDAVTQSAAACFTAPSTVRMYRERYPEVDAERFRMLENGYDERQFDGLQPARSGAGPFTIAHSGIVYPSERDPRCLFDAVAELKREGSVDAESLRIRLRASANDDVLRPMLSERSIDDIVHLEPAIPYREALREMMEVDGLLVLQASNCNHQIPAKIYEYIRAGTPILALTDRAGDTAQVLGNAGVDAIYPLDSTSEIKHGIKAFMTAVQNNRAAVPGQAAIDAASRRGRTAELAALFDRIAEGN